MASFSSLIGKVSKELISVVTDDFKLPNQTPVQEKTIVAFVSHKDVIVQSPTGSGKTLAYLLPIYQILTRRSEKLTQFQVGALILVPSRELANQVSSVCKPFAARTGLTTAKWIGGNQLSKSVIKFKNNGANVIVATPGRFEQMLNDRSDGFNIIDNMKQLEVLIVDEADRFIGCAFQKSVTEILSKLPKQRRTGLFSATQATEMEDLVKFGLRNPLRITVAGEQCSDSEKTKKSISPENQSLSVLPASLHTFYTIVAAEQKLNALVRFIQCRKKAKILVFFASCACVDYFGPILKLLVPKRKFLSLHGKKKGGRMGVLQKFRDGPNPVMLSTDIMSRGIHLPDIHWVVQFDIPRQSSWYVHRSGRAGRCGRQGKSLLILSEQEDAYVPYLKSYEKITHLQQMKIDIDLKNAEKIRENLIKTAQNDREFLERGSRAFVSFVQFYCKHDCKMVCKLKDLDLVGYAHSYGILRLPKLKELYKIDLTGFRRSDIDTSKIAYKNPTKEANRQRKISQHQAENEKMNSNSLNSEEKSAIKQKKGTDSKRKRRQPQETAEGKEWQELASDISLMKRMKRGRLSKADFDQHFHG